MGETLGLIIKKGGVGKTLTAFNLSHILSVSGYRVLFIELDEQRNSADLLMMGIPYLNMDCKALFCSCMPSKEDFYREFVYETNYDGIDCIPGSPELKDIIYDIYNLSQTDNDAFMYFRKNLSLVKEDYDYIVLDTNPSDTTLTRCAICACDYILSPIKADKASYTGVADLMSTINQVKKTYHISPEFMGMFFADVSLTGNGFKELQSFYSENFPDYYIPVAVRHSVFVSDSTLKNLPLLLIDKNHNTSKDYIELAKYIGLIDKDHIGNLERFLTTRRKREKHSN